MNKLLMAEPRIEDVFLFESPREIGGDFSFLDGRGHKLTVVRIVDGTSSIVCAWPEDWD